MKNTLELIVYRDALCHLIQRAGGELVHLDADGPTITMAKLCQDVIDAGRAVWEAERA